MRLFLSIAIVHLLIGCAPSGTMRLATDVPTPHE